MSPASDELHDRIDRLRKRLATETELDAELRMSLLKLLDEISAQRAATSSATAPPSTESSTTLAGRVTQAAQDFEQSYPVLAETIGNVADVLSRMGI